MTRYAIFLRAVNLGSHNKVPMARLRELAEDLGYADVATYVQSGNLTVSADAKRAGDVETAIHNALRRALDLDIDVVARSHKELAAVVAGNPFTDRMDDPKQVHVSLLAGEPKAAARKSLDPAEFDPERFELGRRCVYFWYPGGYGRSKMAAAPWAKRLGVVGTDRNWRTITTMLDRL